MFSSESVADLEKAVLNLPIKRILFNILYGVHYTVQDNIFWSVKSLSCILTYHIFANSFSNGYSPK